MNDTVTLIITNPFDCYERTFVSIERFLEEFSQTYNQAYGRNNWTVALK